MEKCERLLPKGTSFAKADEVCRAWYKRRKCMYFEQMLFLIPETQDRANSSKYSPMTVSNGEEDTDERREDYEGSNDGTAETYTCRKKQSERNASRKINYEQQLLDILKEKSEHFDEDKPFLLSLVPGFKKLDDNQKYWAKMEMLEIMRRAKNMVFQLQYAQL
jgi:hypothetical protein